MLVIMGVSGSGKSTIAAQVAGRLHVLYVDGDDLHPAANVAKMRSGTPLTDDDRWPWLDQVGKTLVETSGRSGGIVLACSALRRAYRDRIRIGTQGRARFAFLDVPFEVIQARLAKRLHHFMPESLLRSQFDTLERPAADEIDVLTISGDHDPIETVGLIAAGLRTIQSTVGFHPPHPEPGS
jgi:gluconokinase